MVMMNMTSSTGMMNITVPTMIAMPFHTGIGLDMLWFAPWMMDTVGSTFGACVGLCLLSFFFRFSLAARSVLTTRKAANARQDPSNTGRYAAFSWSTDLQMGLLEGVIAFVGYFLMLAVMVMNTWWFIGIILGVIAGETAFGRFGRPLPQTQGSEYEFKP